MAAHSPTPAVARPADCGPGLPRPAPPGCPGVFSRGQERPWSAVSGRIRAAVRIPVLPPLNGANSAESDKEDAPPPRPRSGLHATFRAGFSCAAQALGVKFPSAECGRASLQSIFRSSIRWQARPADRNQEALSHSRRSRLLTALMKARALVPGPVADPGSLRGLSGAGKVRFDPVQAEAHRSGSRPAHPGPSSALMRRGLPCCRTMRSNSSVTWQARKFVLRPPRRESGLLVRESFLRHPDTPSLPKWTRNFAVRTDQPQDSGPAATHLFVICLQGRGRDTRYMLESSENKRPRPFIAGARRPTRSATG